MRTLWPLLLLRLGLLLGGVSLLAVLLRISGQVLQVLPPQLQSLVAAGWAEITAVVTPVLPALAALGLVLVGLWLLAGRR